MEGTGGKLLTPFALVIVYFYHTVNQLIEVFPARSTDERIVHWSAQPWMELAHQRRFVPGGLLRLLYIISCHRVVALLECE